MYDEINRFEKYGRSKIDAYQFDVDSDWDSEDSNTEFFTVGKKVQIDLADMDYKSWRTELQADSEILGLLIMSGGLLPPCAHFDETSPF